MNQAKASRRRASLTPVRARFERWTWLLLAGSLLICAGAAAQSEQVESEPRERADKSARAGMFMPWSMAPRTDSQRAFTRVMSGYDSLRRSAALDGAIDVTLYGPIAVRVGLDYGERPGSELRPSGGLRVQALSQERHGIDMSVGAFYRPEGFTEGEGEIEGVVAFGRRIQRWLLIANLVYGQDPEGAERDGEVRFGTLYQLVSRLQIGLDTRMRFDLGSEEGERKQEGGANYDIVASPTLSYCIGPVSFLANAGFHGVGAQSFQTGFLGLLGVGGAI